jgi:hypothetical protein
MRKIFSAIIFFAILFALPANAAAQSELDRAVARAASYVQRNVRNPVVNSVGGEWAVIGLARSGLNVNSAYFAQYFSVLERHLKKNNGVLDSRRITEYSRVILALTAAGFDPRNVAGYDLTLPLGDFERTVWQGINGAIFALLALDSLDYEIPINEDADVQATREMYVNEISRRQTSDGGWNLTAGANGDVCENETGDPDITGMALQALAKYQDDEDVAEAIERALKFLSRVQNPDGGFTGNFSKESALESTVQVLVALVELEIPVDDPRFVKNGNTLLDSVLSFQNRDGSFRHTHSGSESNLMSTEIGLYGLVSAQRRARERNSLYRMDDRVQRRRTR